MNAETLRTAKTMLIDDLVSGSAADLSERLSVLLDDHLCRCFEQSPTGLRLGIIDHPFAVVALGSYGRREPCLRSDIALLFLFGQAVPPEAEQLIEEFVYPLWDAGFAATHVVRTLEDCLHTAESDVEVLVSLLDARFVCGMSALFFSLGEGLRKQVVSPERARLLSTLAEENRKRHEKFGDSSYLLEPNLKQGRGSLGDYDAMLSMARIDSDLRTPKDLAASGYLSEKEFEDIQAALAFILRIRNALHHLAGRKCDQLFMEYQLKMADMLGYEKKDGQEPVERLMGDLHGHMRTIKRQYLNVQAELGQTGQDRPRYLRTRIKGLWVNDKTMLDVREPETLLKTPDLLAKLFAESASLQIPLSAEARRLVRDLGPELVTPALRKSRSVIRAVEKVLLTPAPVLNVLDDMVRTGFLQCLIPEFEGIVNRIQYNEYHLYPVDKHSLMTVREAKAFGRPGQSDSLCEAIYAGLPDKRILLWACLLHDIGKSDPDGRHSEKGARLVGTILGRLGYEDDVIDPVAFLVREHLFLAKTATRRDINDEETAVFCARRIKEPGLLDLLFLLTVADSRATGPKAWNDWTRTLLHDLYHRTMTVLHKGEFEPDQALSILESKKTALARIAEDRGLTDKAFERLFGLLSLRYLITVPAETIAAHLDLYRNLGDRPFAWTVTGLGTTGPRTLTLSARNRPGLFSRVAGVLTLCGFNILDAQIFTWKNNTALDIFHLSPPSDDLSEKERLARAEDELTRTLIQGLNLSVRLDDLIRRSVPGRRPGLIRPPRIVVDNETSAFFTIIEVHTDDYPGLLFRITDALFTEGLDVYTAKIATTPDQVVDVFYVRNHYGEKVHTPEQITRLKKNIGKVLERH
ncbi:[protein-PII] uridylyltransferase [Desulfatiferula olefinivorans]